MKRRFPNISHIIEDYLSTEKYDGLINPEKKCLCELSELMNYCEGNSHNCQAWKKDNYLTDKINDQLKENRWIDANVRLPKSNIPVIVCIEKENIQILIIATYFSKFEKEVENLIDFYFHDYNEENDTWYLAEGWYEFNFYSEIDIYIEDKVTHWLQLPDKPKG